ncbi:GLPGLI family protein [Flavobacterium sp. J49]|uniref:GLPGLI family protein n=1 Tax=Flavobacterium sp. J49 TaxID=2718534 RepID=UPI001593C4A0|nr:GLPGLI family protein [Flavobacterium sp. J49]MBF6641886.1 GLPGLI family protein [Flavobacterium sp. J49]NIC03133.1 GLPGLI family protein [Flavobacterium sp. J49]
MKKIVFASFLVFSYLATHAQKDFQGMAVYESKTSTSDFKSRFEGNREISPEMQKMIEERMKKMFEKTFFLNFDKSASIYKEEEKLETPGQGQGGFRMMSSMMGGGGTYYKNVKDKTYKVDKEFMGKEFLVKDSLVNYNWQMTGETRVIGGYNCFKATAVIPASKTDFRNFRPKKEEEKKDEKAKEETKEGTKTSFMDQIELPKEITITAWYTPEIPVSQGPEGYWGLPGLILEVNDGKTTILCSKIVLNPKDKAEIKAPSNGKQVSQKEYDEIVVKKMEEMQEMNNGRGGGFQMRMTR